MRRCRLPLGRLAAWGPGADAWEFIFPAGRQLPHLKELDISYVQVPYGGPASAPDGTRLLKCCPGLQSLKMRDLHYTTENMAPLKQLSGLHTLALYSNRIYFLTAALEVVGQMTRLQELALHAEDCRVERLLQQLTGLRQLTKLDCLGSFDFHPPAVRMQNVSS